VSSSTVSPFRSALAWLLFPFFICLLLFWLIPLSSGVMSSLYADPAAIVSSSTVPSSTALTLKNYTDLVQDGQYRKALKNTFVYGISSVLIILPLAFVLAHWLKRSHRRVRPLLTFGLMVPGLTPPVILGILFLMVFHGRYGVLNTVFVDPLLTLLQSFGWIEPGPTHVNWLKDPAFIMPAMILQGVWRWTGFVALFFLCGLEAIPATYYEAARLEGAGPLHRMRYVSLPYLKPVIAFSAIYLLIDAFAMFSGAYSLLGGSGGTDDAGLLLVSYAYFTGFKFHEPASAAAISMSVVPLMMVVIWAILFGTSRREVTA
jgi:ABC-type sugar transport system permease subunit